MKNLILIMLLLVGISSCMTRPSYGLKSKSYKKMQKHIKKNYGYKPYDKI